jgi:hypothetical protein
VPTGGDQAVGPKSAIVRPRAGSAPRSSRLGSAVRGERGTLRFGWTRVRACGSRWRAMGGSMALLQVEHERCGSEPAMWSSINPHPDLASMESLAHGQKYVFFSRLAVLQGGRRSGFSPAHGVAYQVIILEPSGPFWLGSDERCGPETPIRTSPDRFCPDTRPIVGYPSAASHDPTGDKEHPSEADDTDDHASHFRPVRQCPRRVPPRVARRDTA